MSVKYDQLRINKKCVAFLTTGVFFSVMIKINPEMTTKSTQFIPGLRLKHRVYSTL